MITLQRFKTGDTGTFGHLIDEKGVILCYTVELPWRGNAHDISCIPAGVYQCEAYESEHLGSVYAVMNVPGRSDIRIHAANDIKDLEGCIGVGNALGTVNGLPGVLNSKITLTMLLSTLPSTFELQIKDVQL